MEAGTAPAAAGSSGTGSKTMADMGLLAAQKFADATALTHKVGDEWVEISYAEFGDALTRGRPRPDRPRARSPATRSRS